MKVFIFSFVVSVLLALLITGSLVSASHYRVSVVNGSISISKS
jgi:hypothetical protein